jgi:hypothetical protein
VVARRPRRVSKRTVSISYDVLLRQYYVSMGGSVQQTYQTLDEAMFQIRRPGAG